MKHTFFVKKALLAALVALAVLATGCIKEDLDACSKLTIRVENAAGEDITNQGEVAGATLYIFDANKNFLEKRQVDKAFILTHTEIKLDNYPDNTKLYIVGWANMTGDNQEIADAKRLEELSLSLKKADGYAQSPDSLYYGNREVTTFGSGILGGDGVIPVRHKTATISVKTSGLPTALRSFGLKSSSDLDFYMNRTLDTYNYSGKLTGDSVSYNPAGQYDTSGEWQTKGPEDINSKGGKQNSFAGEKLSFTIQSKDGRINETVYEALNIETGVIEPFRSDEGGRVDVLIEFIDGAISAKMRISPWGVVDDSIQF